MCNFDSILPGGQSFKNLVMLFTDDIEEFDKEYVDNCFDFAFLFDCSSKLEKANYLLKLLRYIYIYMYIY